MRGDRTSKIIDGVLREFLLQFHALEKDAPDGPEKLLPALAKYEQDLRDSGCTDKEVRWFMSFEFLTIQINWVTKQPSNRDEVANVLVNHLMVENQMRNLLAAHSPGIDWFSEKLSFEALADLCKNFAVHFAPRRFNAGLKEMARIRNCYAHRINYSLQDKDVTSMRKFLDVSPNIEEVPVNYTVPEAFDHFCYLAFYNFQLQALYAKSGKIKNHIEDPLSPQDQDLPEES